MPYVKGTVAAINYLSGSRCTIREGPFNQKEAVLEESKASSSAASSSGAASSSMPV